jgi:hypothetical protein
MAYMTPNDQMDRRRMLGSSNPDANAPGPGQLEPDGDGGGGDAGDNAPPAPAEGQTADVPMAMMGGKTFNPGEEVVMKVVSVDKDSGMYKLAYATDDSDNDKGGGNMSDEHPAVSAVPGAEEGY